VRRKHLDDVTLTGENRGDVIDQKTKTKTKTNEISKEKKHLELLLILRGDCSTNSLESQCPCTKKKT
jgi:hypothetical protein